MTTFNSYIRNHQMLEHLRILYVQYPDVSIPYVEYDWGRHYPEGTTEYYHLFRGRGKINTFKSLSWHVSVLRYLNPEMNQADFNSFIHRLCKLENGFLLLRVKTNAINDLLEYIHNELDAEDKPHNSPRKIVFNWNCGLSPEEKMSIAGSLSSNISAAPNDIYESMVQIHEDDVKISSERISVMLGCSKKTVDRNMNAELKIEKKFLNQQLKLNQLK